MQRYKHGGALLLTSDPSTHLKVHHPLVYDRLPRALCHFVTQVIREEIAKHDVYEHLLPANKTISTNMFREFVDADFEVRRCMSEMAGCVRFVASLSRVDGLVLINHDLKVHGFATEIVDVPEITKLYRATDETGEHLEEI